MQNLRTLKKKSAVFHPRACVLEMRALAACELSQPRSQARHAAKTGRAGPQASRMKPPVPHWAAATSRPASWADELVSTQRLRSTTKDQMSKILLSSMRLVVVL